MKVCRLCLHSNPEDLISVLNNEGLAHKIKECVSIEVTNDELPSIACTSCVKKVENWCTFRDACLKSNKALLEWSKRKEGDKNKSIKFTDTQNLNGHDSQCVLILEKNETKEFVLSDKNYTCEICSEKFSNCLDYLDHQFDHDGQPVFKCDKCEEVFSSRDDLVQHDKNHKSPCPKCGKMILKSSLKLHLIKHTDRYKCPHCSNCFTSRPILKQHIITVHTDQKNHICETCGKCFSSNTALNVHLHTHSSERRYQCKLCEYAGRTASAMYVHMSTHKQDVCVCEKCSKIFKSSRNLNDHLRRVHKSEKKHQCTYCNKKFADKCKLSVHVRCHTGVRPYVCYMCQKSFIRSDALNEHLVTHRERVWFPCNQCGKKFVSKKGIARHRCHNVIDL